MSSAIRKTDRTGSPRIAATRSADGFPFTETRRFFRSAALELYERELAFFEADREFLTAEKAAERCLKLSLLLTQAHMESS
jgi:hypothetical protein